MLSIQKKFLFIHVHKTGGHSIQNILREYSEDTIECITDIHDGIERYSVKNNKYKTKKHTTLSEYKKVLEPYIFENIYKFATIRNPWDKAISFYFSPHRRVEEWNRDIFIKTLRQMPTLRSFIQYETRFLRTLRKFKLFIYSNDLDAHVDFIMRFEELESDFKKVCKQLEIKTTSLTNRNASNHKHYSKYYDKEMIEMVRDKFSEEIEFGDYKFEIKKE
ncbi:MAG: hypothetical protein ACJA01_002516 [Saprospiraceae bacterium]|jgi:hypothetical protein